MHRQRGQYEARGHGSAVAPARFLVSRSLSYPAVLSAAAPELIYHYSVMKHHRDVVPSAAEVLLNSRFVCLAFLLLSLLEVCLLKLAFFVVTFFH